MYMEDKTYGSIIDRFITIEEKSHSIYTHVELENEQNQKSRLINIHIFISYSYNMNSDTYVLYKIIGCAKHG